MATTKLSNLYFDPEYYKTSNPDLNPIKKKDLINHYLKHGEKEKRNPARYFNTDFYSSFYKINTNIFEHYLATASTNEFYPNASLAFLDELSKTLELKTRLNRFTLDKLLDLNPKNPFKADSIPRQGVNCNISTLHASIEYCIDYINNNNIVDFSTISSLVFSTGIFNKSFNNSIELKKSYQLKIKGNTFYDAAIKEQEKLSELKWKSISLERDTLLNENSNNSVASLEKKIWDEEVLNKIAKKYIQKSGIPSSSEPALESSSFSIVTLFYKHIGFFADCIKSVDNLETNTGLEYEWIILNNDEDITNKDLLQLIPDSLQKKTTIISGEEKASIPSSLTAGITLAKYDWILQLDCDDMIQPQALIILDRYIRTQPDAEYFSSNLIDIDINNNIIGLRTRMLSPESLLAKGNIAGHLKAIKKSFFYKAGFPREDSEAAQDYDTALIAYKENTICFIPEYLYFYRWHKNSQSFAYKNKLEKLELKVKKRFILENIEILKPEVINNNPTLNGLENIYYLDSAPSLRHVFILRDIDFKSEGSLKNTLLSLAQNINNPILINTSLGYKEEVLKISENLSIEILEFIPEKNLKFYYSLISEANKVKGKALNLSLCFLKPGDEVLPFYEEAISRSFFLDSLNLCISLATNSELKSKWLSCCFPFSYLLEEATEVASSHMVFNFQKILDFSSIGKPLNKINFKELLKEIYINNLDIAYIPSAITKNAVTASIESLVEEKDKLSDNLKKLIISKALDFHIDKDIPIKELNIFKKILDIACN